jgi:hypothetical protein
LLLVSQLEEILEFGNPGLIGLLDLIIYGLGYGGEAADYFPLLLHSSMVGIKFDYRNLPQIGLNIDSLMLVISMLVADCFGG